MASSGRSSDSAAIDSRRRDWERVRRVLCVRLDAMGDVLMTAPALAAARHSSAERRHVTLLTSPAGAEAAKLLPDADDVLVYEAPWVKARVKATPAQQTSAQHHDLIRRLAALQFDAAVIFTVYSQNPLPAATTCWLADIPRRLAHCRENPYQLLTDFVPEPEPDAVFRHEVRRQLDLVAAVGWHSADERMRLDIPAGAQARAAEQLARHRLPCRRRLPSSGASAAPGGEQWAVLHPGASAPSRRYPAEHYARAVQILAESHGWRFLLTGTGPERPLLERIRNAAPAEAVVLACDLPLDELAALIEQAPLLISNNTGPVHIAAAVGTPVVDLYALTNLQHTPWQVPSRVLFTDVPCRSCYKSICPEGHHRCLDTVSPGRVVNAALELMHMDRSQRQGREPDLPADIVRVASSRTRPRVPPSATRIDVLIPSCRRPAALAVTLTGLAAQTYRNFRVFVSDQSERPEPPPGEVLAASRVLEAHGCSVRLMQHLPRRGVAENRDYLLAQSDARFVLCLDDDLILEPFVLEMLVDVLEREDCGFVGSAVIGLSFVDDRRPDEQDVTFWEGPVEPEEVLPGTKAWERSKLHNAANLWHVQQRIGAAPTAPRRYKVAWVSGCVLYDAAKLREVGGFSFWRALPESHSGEDVLAQLRVMKAYGGCGVMPSGVYHQELPTTVPERGVDAARVLGLNGVAAASPRHP